MNKTFAVALLLAAGQAWSAEIRFDHGIDVTPMLKEIREATRSTLITPAGIPRHLSWMPGCKDVTMAPAQTRSESFTLASTELVEYCDVPGPGGPGNCRTTFGRTMRETFLIAIENPRPPSEAEVFNVCYEGSGLLTLKVVRSPYGYTMCEHGGVIHLTPKVPSASSPAHACPPQPPAPPAPQPPAPGPRPGPEPPQAP